LSDIIKNLTLNSFQKLHFHVGAAQARLICPPPYTPAGSFGQVKRNVAPFPSSDSTLTVPPDVSTIFFTTDSPTPVLSTLSRGANVWKITNIF
jgi:hypothetical protein